MSGSLHPIHLNSNTSIARHLVLQLLFFDMTMDLNFTISFSTCAWFRASRCFPHSFRYVHGGLVAEGKIGGGPRLPCAALPTPAGRCLRHRRALQCGAMSRTRLDRSGRLVRAPPRVAVQPEGPCPCTKHVKRISTEFISSRNFSLSYLIYILEVFLVITTTYHSPLNFAWMSNCNVELFLSLKGIQKICTLLRFHVALSSKLEFQLYGKGERSNASRCWRENWWWAMMSATISVRCITNTRRPMFATPQSTTVWSDVAN